MKKNEEKEFWTNAYLALCFVGVNRVFPRQHLSLQTRYRWWHRSSYKAWTRFPVDGQNKKENDGSDQKRRDQGKYCRIECGNGA